MTSPKVAPTAFVVLAALVPAACARPSNSPPTPASSSAPASTAPDCDISGARVHWSGYAKQPPRLTRVTLFRVVPEDPATHTGKDVLDEPLVPAIAGMAAPTDWLSRLAKSLGAETGDEIHAEPAQMKDGGFSTITEGRTDPSIPETVLYVGVEAVSASFAVDCAPPVRGTLTAWTSMSVGSVACGQIEAPAEPLGRLARQYCPSTP